MTRFIARARGTITEWRRRRFSRRVFESEFLDPRVLEATERAVSSRAPGTDFDTRRLAMTIEWIRRFGLDSGRVVDIGGEGHPISEVLWEVMGVEPERTDTELRTAPLPFADDSVDAVVCLEVLEHLSDVPYGHATTLSGVRHHLSEIHRVLRVGGRALITTPNAASYWAIRRALDQEPPMLYEWHFREFTVAELTDLLESTGFRIEEMRTEFVWHLWGFRSIEKLAARHAGTDDRGDDIFVVVSKVPSSERTRVPTTLGTPGS